MPTQKFKRLPYTASRQVKNLPEQVTFFALRKPQNGFVNFKKMAILNFAIFITIFFSNSSVASGNCKPIQLLKEIIPYNEAVEATRTSVMAEENAWKENPDVKAEQTLARLMQSGLVPFPNSITGEKMHEALTEYFITGRYANSYLREKAGQVLSNLEKENVSKNLESVRTMINGVDAFFVANGPHGGKTLIMFRGEGEHGVERVFKTGQTVSFPNYMSLSSKPDISAGFTVSTSKPSERVFYTVRVPGSIPAVDLHMMLGNDRHAGTEILLPRGLELRVDAARLSERGWEVAGIVLRKPKHNSWNVGP